MTDVWRCSQCSYRTLDKPKALRHSNLQGHIVKVRRMAEATRTPQRWVCEQCPYETHEQHRAEGHETEQGHAVVLAAHAKTHPGRELARPETTGPGAVLTDGRELFEVIDCRTRKVRTGTRTLETLERKLVDVAKNDDDDQEQGAWCPFAEVMALEVVKPVPYEDPRQS